MSVVDEVLKLLQTAVAPELKAITVRLDAMEKLNELRFTQINARFDDLLEKLALSKRVENLEREREEKRAS